MPGPVLPPIQTKIVPATAGIDTNRRSWRMTLFNDDGTPFTSGVADLADLTDVDLTDLTDGDILVWDATAEKWIRATAPSGGSSDTDAWHTVGSGGGEPAFGSGWGTTTAIGATGDVPDTYPATEFRKVNGTVLLRGVVTGSYGTPVFVLPVGYRPSSTHIYYTQAQGQAARMQIEPNGDVIFADGSFASPTWLDLATVIPLDPP